MAHLLNLLTWLNNCDELFEESVELKHDTKIKVESFLISLINQM